MRIAFVCGRFPVLSETFIANQIIGLLDSGHEVDIYSLRRPEVEPSHEMITKYNLLDRTTYLDTPSDYVGAANLLTRTTVRNPDDLTNVFGSLKQGTRSVNRVSVLNIRDELSQYDVVHAHFGTIGMSVDFLSSTVPTVVSFYGSDASKILTEDPHAYDRLWKTVDRITVLSYDMKERLVVAGCPEDMIDIVPLPIDADQIEFSPTELDSPIQIATVARFVEKKGLEYAVRAIARVADVHAVRYVIAGDGERREQIERLINELSIEDSVELLGWVSQEEVTELLDESHLFLLPSRTASDGDKEGTPTVLLEAQASGVPPVSTYHAGIPEIVEHNKRGILCPPLSVEKLSESILEMIERSDEWSRMAQSGRDYINRTHTRHAVAETLIETYRTTMTNK